MKPFCLFLRFIKKKEELMKKMWFLVVLFHIVGYDCFSQELTQIQYQKGINTLHQTLNGYRADLNKMDSVCLDYVNGNLPYTRFKTTDSLFPFVLNKKLCDEALKRCRENLRRKRDVFKATHLYESFECDESIYVRGTSKSFNLESEMKHAILSLIVDGEPIVGHREMMLDPNPRQKYIGYGYVIVSQNGRIEVIVVVLTSTLKGLQNPINFNNAYIDQSRVIHISKKQMLEEQRK